MKRNSLVVGLTLLGVAAITIPTIAQANQQAIQPTIVNANPFDHTPFVQDGRVEALTKIGNRVYVAGNFTKVKNWKGSSPVENATISLCLRRNNRVDRPRLQSANQRAGTCARVRA